MNDIVRETQANHLRYRAKIDRVSPITRRSTFERERTCFLGISLENSNFVRPKLIGIVEWISRRFPECIVLIGDSIHRITLATTRGLGPDAALEEALRLGREFREQEAAVFDAFSSRTRFSFVTCHELQDTNDYVATRARLAELFERDAGFRSSVESFGRSYHAKHSGHLTFDEREACVRDSCTYFLEEFAIFAGLHHRGARVMVYPGSFSTLAEIAAGQHPAAPGELIDLTVVSLCLRGTR